MSIHDFLARHAGTEDLGLDIPEDGVVPAVEVAQAIAEREVAETDAKVEELAAQVEELTEIVEDTQETVEEIEETVEGIESLLSGNWNSKAAQLMFNKLQRLNYKAGGEAATDRLGAESFADSSTAEMYMRQGIEGAMDTVKKWGESAIAFIKKIFDQVVAFVTGLFDKAKGLRKNVEILKAKLNAANFKVKETVKVGDWNRYVDVENFKPESEMGVTGLDSFAADPIAYASDVSKFEGQYKKVVDEVRKWASSTTEKKEGSDTTIIGRVKGIRMVIKHADASTIKKVDDIAKAMRTFKVSFVNDPDTKIKTSGEVKTSLKDKGALSKMLDEVIDICKFLESKKSSKAMTSATRDKVISEVKSEQGKADEDSKKVVANITAIYASVLTNFQTGVKFAGACGTAMVKCVGAHAGVESSDKSDKKED